MTTQRIFTHSTMLQSQKNIQRALPAKMESQAARAILPGTTTQTGQPDETSFRC